MFLLLRHLRAQKRCREEIAALGQTNLRLSSRAAHLSIRFLVDWFAARPDLRTEAGVAYLIDVNDTHVLFDLGLGARKQHVTPLLHNARKLDVDLSRVAGIFISHNHLDHVGGLGHQRRRTPNTEQLEIQSETRLPIWAPAPLLHSHHRCIAVDHPAEVLPGIATTGALPANLYVTGSLREQAAILPYGDSGCVLVVGCGHPGILTMVRHARAVTGEPVRAVVGGFHLLMGRERTRGQKLLGSSRPPYLPLRAARVRRLMLDLKEQGVETISPSAHDTCDVALGIMTEVFGGQCVPIRVGEQLTLGAQSMEKRPEARTAN